MDSTGFSWLSFTYANHRISQDYFSKNKPAIPLGELRSSTPCVPTAPSTMAPARLAFDAAFVDVPGSLLGRPPGRFFVVASGNPPGWLGAWEPGLALDLNGFLAFVEAKWGSPLRNQTTIQTNNCQLGTSKVAGGHGIF